MVASRRPIRIFLFLVLIFASLPMFSTAQDQTIVKEIIDGDTLKVTYKGREEKIRLIGIDAPESRVNPRAEKQAHGGEKDLKTIISMGQESTKFVRNLVKPGDQVKIEFDLEKRDQYGRLLGYVYLPDGRMLNEEMVRAGYASLLSHPPNVKYQERFLEAYRGARENGRGLWR